MAVSLACSCCVGGNVVWVVRLSWGGCGLCMMILILCWWKIKAGDVHVVVLVLQCSYNSSVAIVQ